MEFLIGLVIGIIIGVIGFYIVNKNKNKKEIDFAPGGTSSSHGIKGSTSYRGSV